MGVHRPRLGGVVRPNEEEDAHGESLRNERSWARTGMAYGRSSITGLFPGT